MVQSKFVSSSNPILRVTAVVPARAKDHFVVSTNNNKETGKKSHCHIIEVINNDLISFLKGAEMMWHRQQLCHIRKDFCVHWSVGGQSLHFYCLICWNCLENNNRLFTLAVLSNVVDWTFFAFTFFLWATYHPQFWTQRFHSLFTSQAPKALWEPGQIMRAPTTQGIIIISITKLHFWGFCCAWQLWKLCTHLKPDSEIFPYC